MNFWSSRYNLGADDLKGFRFTEGKVILVVDQGFRDALDFLNDCRFIT